VSAANAGGSVPIFNAIRAINPWRAAHCERVQSSEIQVHEVSVSKHLQPIGEDGDNA
jgi:methionyl-tRNA formyltransferase